MPFDPNKPYEVPTESKPVKGTKPEFNPDKEFKLLGETKYIAPITNFNHTDIIDQNNEQKINSTLDFVQQNSRRTLRDDEKDILKNMIKNPYTTQEQLSDAIVTLQGKKAKQISNITQNEDYYFTPDYYMKKDENTGNYVPVALGQKEVAPEGYKVASIWGTQQSANDDAWYTDLGKSLANGVVGFVGSIADTADAINSLVNDEDSQSIKKTKQNIESFKFNKDEKLDTPILNTEGIKEWSDLLDPERYNLNKNSLWGTLNMAAESFTEFGLGALTGTSLLKTAKAGKYALQGIDKAVELGSKGRKAAIFTGSFMSQLGENLDNAEYAGLKGRDKAIAATITTAPMALIDAAYGLEGKIMDAVFRKGKRELFTNLISSIERDAAGNITEQGFRDLASATTVGYGQLAKSGLKNIAGNALKEGAQETAQEFVKKSGEQLWDKFSAEDKAKFGTNAFSAKSFGDYANSLAMGLISGVPLSLVSARAKVKADAKSQNAFTRVQEGPEAVKALRTDLNNSFERGEITESERDEAFFKLEKYQKYNELTEKYNLKPEDKEKAFKLTFQIEGLNTEIPANNQLHELNPIQRADIESKRRMQAELQKELNDIILRSDVIAEPTVPEAVQEKIEKDDSAEFEKTQEDKSPVEEIEVPTEKPAKLKPKSTRRSFEDTPAGEFNALDSLRKKQTVQEHLKHTPNKAIQGYIEEGQNGKLHVNIGGKYLTFAQSVKPTQEGKEENIRRENLPATMEKGKVRTLNGEVAVNPDTLEPLTSFAEPVNVQRQEIDAYDEEGNQLFDGDGSPRKKAVLNVFNGQTGKYIISIREKDKQAGRKYQASQYAPKEIEQLKELQEKGFQTDEIVDKPVEKPKSKEANALLQKGIENNRVRREELIKEGKTVDEADQITYDEFLETEDGKKYLELTATEEYESNKKQPAPEKVTDEKSANKPIEKTREDIENIKDPEDKKVAEIEYIMKNLFAKVGEASANKIKEYADRIKKGENKESVLSGLPKSFVEGVNQLLNAELTEETKPVDKVEEKPNKKSIKSAAEIKSGDRISDINGKKGTVSEVNGNKITIKLDNGAVLSADIRFVELFKEEKKEPRPKAPVEERPEAKTEEITVTDSQNQSMLDNGYTQNEVNRAITEANRLVGLSNIDLFKALNSMKMFSALGNIGAWRFDSRGLSSAEFISATKNILAGKTNLVSVQKVFDVLNEIKKYGHVPMQIGNGITAQKANMPLFEFLLEKELNPGITQNFPLTSAEIENELAAEEERKQGRFQKLSQHKGDINKVVYAISKALPNIAIEYTDKGEFAGKLSENGKTITINTNYAGLDTPIHEAGHVLIDAVGYNNSIIQKAIKQLRETPLYAETKDRYPELNEKELDKEVLAEAIGREGANIFEDETAKNKFKTYLNYIYDWLKTKLGLNKNIAKSLSKQIISGIGTKGLKGTDTGTIQEQRNKSKLKTMTYSQYRQSKARFYEQEEKDIASAESVINDPNSTPEAKEKVKKTIKNIKSVRSEDTKQYRKYKADAAAIQQIINSEDLSKYSTDQLIDLFNQIKNFEFKAKEVLMKDVMLRIATTLHKQGKARIMADHLDYIESLADKKDIGKGQIWLLHGSHFSEYQPEMQEAYRVIQEAQLNKLREANDKKATNEALAKKVIEEKNKQLGLTNKVVGTLPFNSDSAKYFEYMDNGKGQLLTIEEAKKKGLSKSQIDYLDFTRKILAEREGLMIQNDYENAEFDVIRVDKKFSESFKQDGLAQAFSYYLGGGGSNLGNVRIMYKGIARDFKDIEKDIISNTKKNDVIGNIKALYELLRYNIAARRQLKRGFNVDERQNPLQILGDAEYSLNTNGQLTSKFDRARSKDRGYSKDFYRAMIEFIDDTSHVKHINPIMAIVDSVETLNRDGYIQEGIQIKPNVAKWIEEFKKLHIFKESKASDPVLDMTLKFFRSLTASTTMWFNLPANAINVAMGNYNNFRQENGATVLLGNKRLFGGKGAMKYGVNKYALDLIEKYSIVNQDFDSNPKVGLGKIFSTLSTIGTQAGEYQIQGSLALGLMSEEDFNSFEYTKDKYGNEILTVKPGIDEKALNNRMIGYKNRVTDIQGKYPDEDRRNIMNTEWAKAIFQFKVWMPDWFKERFGARYINSRNEVKEGTFNKLMREGFKQIKADIDQKGLTKALWENKTFMSNLKGLASIGFLLALKYKDDDDDKKRKAASLVENTLGQLLFITDFDQLKYTLSNPVAALGKAKDAVSAIEALVKLETNKKGEYTADDKISRLIPARKLIEPVVSAVTE